MTHHAAPRDAVIGARPRRLLAGLGSDVAGALTDGRHSLVLADGVWWLTGFRSTGDAAVVIEGTSVMLFVSSRADAQRAHRTAVADSVRYVADPIAACSRVVGAGGEVPLVGVGRLNRARRAKIQCRWVDADITFARVARRPDDLEMGLFAAATALAEDAYRSLLDWLRPGQQEHEVAGRFSAELRAAGSEDNFLFMSAAGHNRAVHRPTARVLAPGDVLLTEISPSLDGVFTQICRTVAIGEPSVEVATGHALLRRAFRAGADVCAPGGAVSAVTAAMNDVLSDAGFGEYCRPPHMRVRGHGLGLRPVAPGDITADSAVVLEEGDTFVLHPNQYLPTAGYLMCGEPLTVMPGGGHLISRECAELGVVS